MTQENGLSQEIVTKVGEFIDDAMANDKFQNLFKDGVNDNTKKMVALQMATQMMIKDTFGPMAAIMGPMMEKKVMGDYAAASGQFIEAELDSFIKQDYHEYITMEHIIQNCKTCDKKEDCDQYKDYVKVNGEPEDK